MSKDSLKTVQFSPNYVSDSEDTFNGNRDQVYSDAESGTKIKNQNDTLSAVSNVPDATFMSSKWPGFGGRPISFSGIEFDRQLDRISQWIDKWSHKQRCLVSEVLLQHCSYSEFQLLCTVMSPALHRDFMYSASKQYPNNHFIPISTHFTRRIKARHPFLPFYRMKSAYLHEIEDVKGSSTDRLPELVTQNYKRQRSSSSSGTSSNSSSSIKLAEVLNGPACLRFVNMPTQRHVQEEKSFIVNGNQSKHYGKQGKGKSKKARVQVIDETISDRGRRLGRWFSLWDDSKRNEFLHKFILKLDPRQLYFISTFLALKQYRDFISLLPEFLSLKVLEYLSPKELVSATKVNRKWKQLCNRNILWRAKCVQVKLEIPQRKLSKNPVWKKLYWQGITSRKNWLYGKCKLLDLKGHKDNVLSVAFDNEGRRLVSGSLDRTIKIWDIKTGTLIQTLHGHHRGIWSLQFFTENFLISGSYDFSIKIWNLRTGVAVRTIFGHEGPVWAISCKTKLMVSGSQDSTAKVWHVSRCHLRCTLKGHNGAIFAIDLSDDESWVVTGSSDRTVRQWSTTDGTCVSTILASQSTSIMSVSFSLGYIACSFGCHIAIFNLSSGQLVNSYSEHHKRIESLKLKMTDPFHGEGVLISGGKDNMVKYWDIKMDSSLHTFTGHTDQINCITFDELRIASASYDHLIKVWDFT